MHFEMCLWDFVALPEIQLMPDTDFLHFSFISFHTDVVTKHSEMM